ncbi:MULTISPECIES: zf-TFIIB domain-containing protein [unclassified Moorena]|uniref:TFIIB-type zinc ribbon-containing protein n=1 Tax=unclassified Moorena TaxID=2683338 RepID=UPI0013C0DACC|nr:MULTISPECIES: zf-TFIIB domain-containing protein [unclassified Moorena]NEP36396.1 zf-TFIIB domain-containing protein [Moorena sp. SIO3B2]NEQ13322.1 zf-TFIIB domain-containing protein [Moorena sp. SIO3E2]NES41032.1 zf-TFIIB domain-containing protein [Moorena sp. SIO2C4]
MKELNCPTLNCPKCKGKLEPVTCHGIEVDRCVNCKGIWFDSLEAEILKKIKGSESLDIGDPEIGSELNKINDDICCPRCGAKMIRMLDIDEYSIWYEKCFQCHGVWLDAGEFRQYKHNFQPRGVLYRVKRMFRAQKDIPNPVF